MPNYKKGELKDYSCEVGNKYGLLTVLKYLGRRPTPSKRNYPIVLCKCECGQERIVSLWDIKSGKTKTCRFDHPHYLDRSIPAFNQLYKHSYKNRALKSGLDFELSKDEFRKLTKSNCHYCGSPPIGNKLTRTGNRESIYVYNGIDRIDSDKGYTLDNVVPCCSICNHAKNNMSYKDFLEWIKRLVAYTRSKDKLIFVKEEE